MRPARLVVAGLVLLTGGVLLALRPSFPGAGSAVRPAPALARESGSRAVEPPVREPHASTEGRSLAASAVLAAPDLAPAESTGGTAAPEPWRVAIEGRVVDDRGEPIEGATLETYDEVVRARSDPAGTLHATAAADPWPQAYEGSSRLGVHARGHASAQLEVQVRDGVTLRLGTIVLGPGTEVVGTVRDESGQPLKAWVTLSDAADRPFAEEHVSSWGEVRQGPETRRSQTDREGRFRIRGAPPGQRFLSAAAEGWRMGWTPVFSLREGEEVAHDLVLALDGTQVRWTLRVLDPDGAPVSGATMRSRTSIAGFGQSRIWRVDDEGTSPFVVERGETHTIQASDALQRWRCSEEVQRTAADDEAIVLALREPVTFPLRVADDSGRAIPSARVKVSVGIRQWPPSPSHVAGEDGILRVLLPEEPFTIEADAQGFTSGRLGPISPQEVPTADGLEIRLTAGLALRGSVVASRPVPDARVTLVRHGWRGESWRCSREGCTSETAFPWLGETLDAEALTDEGGAFLVGVPGQGSYWLVVVAPGWPEQPFGPFEVGGATRDVGALALAPAGALEGRVLLPPFDGGHVRLVGASNGLGTVHSAPIDADGRYRIDGLAPGRTFVRPCRTPLATPHRLRSGWSVGSEAPPFDCVVEAGRTTRFDLDLSGEGSVVLEGRIAASPDEGADVQLAPVGDETSSVSDEVAREGTFRLAVSRAGLYELGIWLGEGYFHQRLELHDGVQRWSWDPAWGRVVLPGGREVERRLEDRYLLLQWTGDAGASYVVWLYDGDLEEDATIRMPAGRIRALLENDDETRTPLGEPFELAADESVWFDPWR